MHDACPIHCAYQMDVTEEVDDLRAEVATLRDVATLRQRVLSDCLAEQRRLKRALDTVSVERDAWRSECLRLVEENEQLLRSAS